MISFRVGVSTGLLLIVAMSSFGQRVVNVPNMQTPPTIDGTVTPAEQKAAEETSLTLIGGYDKPKHPTNVYIGLLPTGLYVGFVCSESEMNSLVSRVNRENGPVFTDDAVELYVTPSKESSRSNYFHFAVNSSGTKYSNSLALDRHVQGWQAAAAKLDNAWNVELLIPYVAIGVAPGETHWRVNFSRIRPDRAAGDSEVSAWVDPGTTFHNYRKFGYALLASARPSAAAAGVTTPTAATISTPAVAVSVTTGTVASSAAVATTATVSTGGSVKVTTPGASPSNPTTATTLTTGTSAIYP